MNQESGATTEVSKVLAEPSVARFSKVMDMILEEVNKIGYRATRSPDITDESDVILGTNSVVINELADFEIIPEQCSTEINDEINEAVGIINVTAFDAISKDDREKRNLETMFVPSKEDGEVIDQAIECVNMPEQYTTEVNEEIRQAVGIIDVTTFDPSSKEDREKNLEDMLVPSKEDQAIEYVNMPEQYITEVNEEICDAVGIIDVTSFDPSSKEDREKRNLEGMLVPSKEDQAIEYVNIPGTSKVAITFNPEKVDETPNPNENIAIFATESFENLETLNAEEKVISAPKRKIRKRKAPPVCKMVLASIKKIKKSDGVSFEDIKNHMEENYPVKVKALVKYHVSNFLQKFVDNGLLEKTDRADSERFIVKKSEFMEI